MAFAHLAIQCGDKPNDDDDPIIINETQVTKAAEAIEDVFLTGNSEKVLTVLTPSALEHYSDLITGSSAENLKAFGEAFGTRTLKILSGRYAEYSFTAGGVDYTIALSMDEDENWKIMRL